MTHAAVVSFQVVPQRTSWRKCGLHTNCSAGLQITPLLHDTIPAVWAVCGSRSSIMGLEEPLHLQHIDP